MTYTTEVNVLIVLEDDTSSSVSAGLVSPEVSLFSLQVTACSLCPHAVSPLHVRATGASLCVQISSSYKDDRHSGLGSTLVASFKLNPLFKGLAYSLPWDTFPMFAKFPTP